MGVDRPPTPQPFPVPDWNDPEDDEEYDDEE